MPRPSLKEVRSEEILDAFMRCVARYGLDGSTTERIADEAGVGRPLLRHYLGNRDHMVSALLAHVIERFERLSAELFDALPQSGRMDALLEKLFVDRDHAPENAAVFQALVAASERHPVLRKPLLSFVTDFETRVAREIRRERAGASDAICDVIAAGIAAIYFNTAAVAPLKPASNWLATQHRAARLLLEQVPR